MADRVVLYKGSPGDTRPDFTTESPLIERLPEDVLSLIFRYVFLSSDPTIRPDTYLAFSQVSRHWRQVALDDALLWTRIDGENPVLATLMLERAKDAPLTVKLSFLNFLTLPENERKLLEAILAKASTIQTLLLSSVIDDPIKPLLALPASLPTLQHLSLSIFSVSTDTLKWSALEHYPSPSLRYVTLRRCSLSWGSLCFRDLVSLKCHSLHNRICVSTLRDVLSRNPLLEELCIEDSILSSSVPRASDYGRVRLLRLKHMALTEQSKNILDVLDIVTLPVSCMFFFDIQDIFSSTEAATNTLHRSIGSFSPPVSAKLTSLTMASPYFKLFYSLQTGQDASLVSKLRCRINTTVFVESPWIWRSSLYDLVPTSDSTAMPSSSRSAPAILPFLTTLEIKREFFYEFLQLLESTSRPSPALIPFPALHDLLLVEVHVPDSYLLRFLAALTLLKDGGWTLQTLTLGGRCSFSPDIFRTLDVVGSVQSKPELW